MVYDGKQIKYRFQHTAARRRLAVSVGKTPEEVQVSTHSRPKAAGTAHKRQAQLCQCFNTQPPEGGWRNDRSGRRTLRVSTHSRPKAAGTTDF